MDFSEATIKRFWEKVDRRTPEECWDWKGATGACGYGCISIRGIVELAHRVSYQLHHGRLKKPQVCHRCDRPLCVNPAHLFNGTHSDNMRDREAKGRSNASTMQSFRRR